jgi:hypothetical protein
MQKVLFIAPHLSTGGCPQYLLKKIQTYRDQYEIYVVEHSFIAEAYVVQRNAIRNLIPEERFFSLGHSSEDKEKLLEIIDAVDPDILHFEELSETICSYFVLEQIYLKHSRRYFITETTHSSESNPDHKVFLPDKFIFASKYSQKKFEKLNVPSEVWEYPIDDNVRPERKIALENLGLDPEKIHILNVGLFTPGKNQGEIIEHARGYGEEIQFHFVGNQAPNFEHYWGPLMKNLPSNCKVWGERNDVEKFMQACDLFYFSSIFELNPLVIKEALSWKIPILMYDLYTYMGTYEDVELIKFLSPDRNFSSSREIFKKSISNIEKGLEKKQYRAKLVHIVSELEAEIEKKSIDSVSKLASKNLEYTIHLNPLTKEFDSNRLPLETNPNLKPGHFGCFEAFRKAIVEDFGEDFDFLIVCERDCVLERSPEEILDLLQKTYRVMKRENIYYFSFGDTADLEFKYPQSDRIRDLEDFAFVTDKIIGLQFIIFSKESKKFTKQMFEEKRWYGMDIWLNIVFNENSLPMGILNERVTTQLDGYSLIDQMDKKFQ